jgi:TfoX/Sxy family transcriptional regulator of competence genes
MQRTDTRPLTERRDSVTLRIAELETALTAAHRAKAEIETAIELAERERTHARNARTDVAGGQHAAE